MAPEREYMDEKLHEKARQIAANMGWEWSYSFEESFNGSAAIVGPEGATVVLGADGYRLEEGGRLEVWGRYPDFTVGCQRHVFDPRPEERPKITVSASRPAHAIARDILRRFVPRYLPYWQKGLELKAAHVAAYEKQEAALEKVSAIWSAARPADPRDRSEEVRVPYRGIYGHVRVGYRGEDGQVDLSSVPIELVYQIAGLVAAYYEQ